MKKIIIFLILIGAGTYALYPTLSDTKNLQTSGPTDTKPSEKPVQNTSDNTNSTATPPAQEVRNIPNSYTIPQTTHVYQTFNNCGPATLSMLLSYYDIRVDQRALGLALRPYQNSSGDNDDKSVTFPEFANQAKTFGVNTAYYPAGTIEKLKGLISDNKPVIVRTWLNKNEDIGHFRLVRGYNDKDKYFLVDDSYDGPNKRISYDEFTKLWEAFGYEYLYVTDSVEPQNSAQAWDELLQMSGSYPFKDFNDAVAYYYLGDFSKSASSYEKVEKDLPKRMLWYQTEPAQAYLKLKNYDKVFEITSKVLENGNRAYSEFYQIRGEAYLEQNQIQKAKEEFEKAIFYNKNYEPAKEKLKEIESL